MTKWINHCKGISSDRVNLLCFPHVGTSSTYFARWIRLCGDEINLIPVQYPMRDNRLGEEMPSTYQEMSDRMAEESPELFDYPFAVFGHCSGAYMAFELSLAARRVYGVEPVAMFLSSAVSPKNMKMIKTRDYTEEQFLKHYNVLDMVNSWDENYKNFFMPILRVDSLMCEDYVYKSTTPLNTVLYLLYGDEDKNIMPVEKVTDWKIHVSSSDAISKVYHGNHFFIDREPEKVCRDIINFLEI